MKMDLNNLCRRLARAREEESVSTRRCNPYLLEEVRRPLMRGEAVRLKSIDFSRFDEEDIHTLAAYYESLEMQGRKLAELVGAIARIEPAACKVRRFC